MAAVSEAPGATSAATYQNDEHVGETLSGWLQKRERGFSGVERWRRCWFVLSNLGGGDDLWTLSHYEHGTNMREFVGAERLAQGERKVAAIGNIDRILFVGSKGNKFDVVFRDDTPKMSLRAANEDVCKRWVYAILRLKQDLEAPQEPRHTKPTGAVSSYSLKPDGFDRRRERESVKMTAAFLKDSEVFMQKAALFGSRAQNQTLPRHGRTGTRRPGAARAFGGTVRGAAGKGSNADEEDEQEDDRAVPPPPGSPTTPASRGSDDGEDADGGARGGDDDGDDHFQEEGYADAAARQRASGGGGGGLLCARRAKPKRTAKLEEIPIPTAAGAQLTGPRAGKAKAQAKARAQGKSERTSSSGGSVDFAESAPPPSADKARATLDKQRDNAAARKKAGTGVSTAASSASSSAATRSGSLRFLLGPGSAGRKANTIVGDETLRRRQVLSLAEEKAKARTGANKAPESEEPARRMAVRPMARMNQALPEGRIQVKLPATAQLIRETIEDSYSLSGMLFDDLDLHSMQDLVDSMYRVDVAAGSDVVNQGEVGDTFFVIEKGKYHVYLRRSDPNALPELVAEKGPRTFFGELALLYEQPAPVTVRAVTDGVLWAINRASFFEIRKAQARKRQARKLRCLAAIDVLAENLPDSALVALAEAMDERVYRQGDVVLEAGAKLSQVIIVGSGRVDVLAPGSGELRSQLTRGDSFGEAALLQRGAKSDLRLVASEDRTTLLTLDVDEFEALLGSMRDVVAQNWLGDAAPRAPAGSLVMAGSVVAGKGSGSKGASAKGASAKGSAAGRRKSKAAVEQYLRSTLLLLQEKDQGGSGRKTGAAAGSARSGTGAARGTAKKSTHRGKGSRAARALLQEQPVPLSPAAKAAAADADEFEEDGPAASAEAAEEEEEEEEEEDGGSSSAAALGKARLPSTASAMSDSFDSDDEDSSAVAAAEASGDVERDWDRSPLSCAAATLNDLEPLERLGKGSFGRVHLVRDVGNLRMTHPRTGAAMRVPKYMALKVLSRDFITSNGWQEMVENERHAMAELALHCDCPFIVNLFAAFFDNKNVYFLMELCSGGDMYGVLRKLKGEPRLLEREARFYIASTCIGMEAIHSRNIVYRDLKPENVFLADDGYVRIADFGLAKKTNRTFTVCGTPEYMAPEIILGRGHDSAVDWWAVGVFCFELISGVSPFPGRSPMDIYESVLAHTEDGKLKFPDHASFSKDCKAFISVLLNPNKSKRLAPVRKGITTHPFFNKFAIDKLLARKLKPPLKMPSRDYRRYESPGFKNHYHAKFKDPPVDRSGWEPAI